MKKKEIGFSLIEVVVALAILGIAILPILSMYPSALKMTTDATRNEEWSRVSMTIVDYVKSRGYDNVKAELNSSSIFEETYTFAYDAATNSYKQDTFASDLGIDTDSFVINTKGIKLNDYQFKVYISALPVSYGALDLTKNQITTNSTNSSIIYGIVKIRKTGESFNGETIRDAKFIITPIEKLGH